MEVEARRRTFVRRLIKHYDVALASACLAFRWLEERTCSANDSMAAAHRPMGQALRETLFGGH
eukprot:7328381-Prymnesium_polylepis.1